jgi:hypothetical protein
MANIASGVHSGAPKTDIEKTVARIRSCATYRVVADSLTIDFNTDALATGEPPFQYAAEAIDPVLVEVLASAHFLARSPDMQRLETMILAELEQFAPSLLQASQKKSS